MTESSNSSPTLNLFATENELGNIDLYGSVVGIAGGTVINFVLTDDDGNSKTVSAVVTGGTMFTNPSPNEPAQMLDTLNCRLAINCRRR